MAKRDDDDLDVDDIADDEADDEADEAEEADEDADDAEDAEDADDEGGDDDDGASDDDEEAEEAEPAKPVKKAKITGLTLTLIILNVLASIGFLFLLLMNYERRQGFTHAGIEHEAVAIGVGTEEDQKGATAGTVTLPQGRLSSKELSDAVPGGETVGAWEGGFDYLLYGDAVSDEVRKKLLSDVGEPVLTIEEEMRRLKTSLPAKIEETAKSILDGAKGDADKRTKISFLLLPICFDVLQVDKLDKRIQAAQGAELDALLLDAGQRRLVADILNPVEIYRPGDIESKKPFIEKVADLDLMKLDDVKEALTRRLDAAAKDKYDGETFLGKQWDNQPRWTIEKRQNAAFLLVSIGYLRNPMSVAPKTPFEERLLIPNGDKRAQRIAGLYDFTAACANYIEALETLQDRVQTALLVDREGFSIKVDNQDRQSDGFVDRRADAIQNIRDVQLNIRRAQERFADLTQQKDKANKLYKDRLAHVKDVQARIQKARTQTAKDAEALRKLQDELFEAQKVLADADALNQRLLREIQLLNAPPTEPKEDPSKGKAPKKKASKGEAK